MAYLGNETNIVRTAPLTATNVEPSAAIARTAIAREGGGLVELEGPFTGQADKTIDIEIVDDVIVGDPRVSAPIPRGVGNATMTDVAADNTVAVQNVTAQLVDLGTETRQAYVPFQGRTLRAKAVGALGNALRIDVDESGVVRTPTGYSLQAQLTKGLNEYTDEWWDFGAVALNPDGTIPASAPRLAMGDDPQVYRHYKTYKDGRYVYSFSPVPVRDVGEGARVKVVTGSHDVTVTNETGEDAPEWSPGAGYALNATAVPTVANGHWYQVTDDGVAGGVEPVWPTNGGTVVNGTVTFIDRGLIENEYAGVTTLYSLLTAIQGDAAALLEVEGVVANDALPGGMGVNELSERTTSYLASLERDGSPYVEDADIGLTVTPTAPTETLRVRCKDATIAGAEKWEVVGPVSGVLPDATTGVAYSEGPIAFEIPIRLPPAASPTSENAAQLELDQARGPGEPVPSLCPPKNFVVGSEGTAKEFRFVYTPRPVDCSCVGLTVVGGPDDELLGIETPTGGAMSTIPDAILDRVAAVTTWYDAFVAANTALLAADTAVDSAPMNEDGLVVAEVHDGTTAGERVIRNERVSAVLKVDRVDIIFAKGLRNLLIETLETIDVETGAPAEFNEDAGALFDEALDDIDTDLTPILANDGGDWWRKWSSVLRNDFAEENPTRQAAMVLQLLTEAFETYLERFKARMDTVKVAAGVRPNFEVATLNGNDVWRDHGHKSWFESKDGSGLLPIQIGIYYHSARRDRDGIPYSTKQFGIDVLIACEDGLRHGDELVIVIDAKNNVRATYQNGDTFVPAIVRRSPIVLGGGQTGDDTQTWKITGSVDAFADYEVYTPDPEPYDDNGLEFLITPGGVKSVLGDTFTLSVEGGRFRWRENGGAWSVSTPIADTVALVDDLVAAFVPGAAPSWLAGDLFSFKAEAVNGPAQLARPVDGALTTSAGTTVVVGAGGPLKRVLIARHTIPADATITLQGSDDNFATTPFDVELEWTSEHIYYVHPTTVNRAKYRLVIDEACSIDWLYLGVGTEMKIRTGDLELGVMIMRRRLPRPASRGGLGVRVEHEYMTLESLQALEALLAHATENEHGRFAVVPNDEEPDQVALVEFVEDSLEYTDRFGFARRNVADRRIGTSLDLVPVP